MKLVIESARTALAQPVSSIVTALIVAGVVAAILSTTPATIRAVTIDETGWASAVRADSMTSFTAPTWCRRRP